MMFQMLFIQECSGASNFSIERNEDRLRVDCCIAVDTLVKFHEGRAGLGKRLQGSPG